MITFLLAILIICGFALSSYGSACCNNEVNRDELIALAVVWLLVGFVCTLAYYWSH